MTPARRGAPSADRLDREAERAGRDGDRHLVALALADKGAADRGLDRDPAGGRVALHGADEVVCLEQPVGVFDLDRGPRLGDAAVALVDELSAPDHLLQLVNPAVEEADLLLGLLVFGVVFDVARLEGIAHALGRLFAALADNLQLVLEALQAFGREQYR